ncbi:MAG TPA: sulfite exporter TauE/SafE family protein [Acidimicrobiales bacterium]|nr:sulfite exporter TauE/SafE family protein [Acidimicrobiales bacterium]
MITLGTVAAVAGIILAAAAVQRSVGFGLALFAVPLLAFVVPTKSAVVIVFLDGAIISAWLVARLWHEIDWATTRPLGVGTFLGAPVGVVILSVVSASTLRLILGVTTCLAAVWIAVSARRTSSSRKVARPVRTFAMGFISGILNTSLATNGPPLVYELRRLGFEGDRFRATISSVFVLSNLIGLPLLAAAGLVTRFDVALAAAAVLPCILGIGLGSRISGRMQPAYFTWSVDLLLLSTGVVTITKAFS